MDETGNSFTEEEKSFNVEESQPLSEISEAGVDADVEKEKHTLHVVYRSNPAFDEVAEIIRERAEALGVRVDAQVFPVGTSEEEIMKWTEDHPDIIKDLRSYSNLFDKTFLRANNFLDNGEREGVRTFDTEVSEGYRAAAMKLYWSSMDIEGARQFMFSEKAIPESMIEGWNNIFQRISQELGVPENIIILPDKLSHHVSGPIEPFGEEVPGNIADDKVTTAIQKALGDAGMSSDRIHIKNLDTSISSFLESAGPSSWVIADRHTIEKNSITYILSEERMRLEKRLVLLLPDYDMMTCPLVRDIFIDEEALAVALKKTVDNLLRPLAKKTETPPTDEQ